MNGVLDLSVLTEFPRKYLLRMKGIGRTGTWEIEKTLNEKGLGFLEGEFGPPKTLESAKAEIRERYVLINRSVYFIKPDSAAVVKIGVCGEDPMKRLRALQTASWENLKIIGLLKNGSLHKERELHEKFWKHHIRGEWFRLDQEILDFIGSACN